MGTLMPTMPACTRRAKSRAVSPSRVKSEVPLQNSWSLMSWRAVSKLLVRDDAQNGAEDLFLIDTHGRA